MGLVVDEIDKTIARTGKSHHEITNTLSNLHPEILFNFENWDQLPSKAKNGIINKIRKTLASFA